MVKRVNEKAEMTPDADRGCVMMMEMYWNKEESLGVSKERHTKSQIISRKTHKKQPITKW
jgi:hypothetical protein